MKSKKLLIMLLLACGMVFAADSEIKQFLPSDFNTYDSAGIPTQDWIPAQMVTLKVKAGSTVYLSNYISTWYGEIKDLGDSTLAEGYNMSAYKYGYVYAEMDSNGNLQPIGDVHYANGQTKDVTYQNPDGPQTKTTTGYLLGTFDQDAEIFFVMTPNGYDTEINSYYPVNDPDDDPPVTSILASRQINTRDLAGNVRVNFGTVDGVGHEFVIGYEATPSTSGQPLPGVLLSALISMGTVTALRKRSRK